MKIRFEKKFSKKVKVGIVWPNVLYKYFQGLSWKLFKQYRNLWKISCPKCPERLAFAKRFYVKFVIKVMKRMYFEWSLSIFCTDTRNRFWWDVRAGWSWIVKYFYFNAKFFHCIIINSLIYKKIRQILIVVVPGQLKHCI